MSRKLEYHENQYRNFIYANTTKASQYEQVAEEAVELAHVAQKIARILRGEQPVAEGVTFESEFEKFIEEYADVELAVFITETIGGGHCDVDKKFLDIYDEKLIRWSERVEEKIGKSIEEYVVPSIRIEEMSVTYKELDELKKGDKVYIKPYKEIKDTTLLTENSYTLFTGIPLTVLEIDEEDLCLVRDDKTNRTRVIPKYVIKSIYKKHDQPELFTRDIRPGDKVYLKSYEEGKESIHLSEGTWNQFCGKPLKVTELCAYTSDYDEEMCVLFDDDTGEYLKVQTHLISYIDEPEITSKVHHPNYYNQNGMEVWDVIKAFTSNLSGAEAFYAGNAIKYILRWNKKNGIEDLEKAKVYIDKIIEGRKGDDKASD